MLTLSTPWYSYLGRCLAIVVLMTATLSATFAVDLAGKSFAITLTAPGGEQSDHLTFTSKELTCKTTGKVAYTATAKKKSKAVTFDATATDAQGATTTITGEVDGQDVTGTITVTPKDGKAMTVTFTSVKTKKK